MKAGIALALCALIVGMALLTPPTSSAANRRPQRCFKLRPNLQGATRGDDLFLIGRTGRDVIHGKAGNDSIYGLPGNDRLCGGRGSDTIQGGSGFDRVNGGLGYDVCIDAERAFKCEEFGN